MGAYQSKLRCLYLPAQSGKTRKSEDLITAVKTAEKETDRESIDIWISANNKLLVYQTTSRLKKDLGLSTDFSDAVIKGKLFSWTSGTSATNIPYTELADRITDGEVEAILVCAHKARLTYLADLIQKLERRRRFTKDINIWIDEADRSCKMWMGLDEVAQCSLVKSITLVSATFTEVFRHFDSVRVIPYLDTHPKPYRRLKDCVQVVEDFKTKDPSTYVELVLDKHPELMAPGLRAFIPGNVFRQTHEDICEGLLARGFAVLLLNGMNKEIRIPSLDVLEETTVVDLKPFLTVKDPEKVPEEFNLILAKLYKKHKLHRYPFAVTGFLCIERGVTFQIGPDDKHNKHNGFLFDYAITCPVKSKPEAYQSMARCFGNVGELEDYAPCTIYSTSKNFANVKEQEEIAVHVAKIVHTEKLELVDGDVLRRAAVYAETAKWLLEMKEFSTFEGARAFIKQRTGRSPNRPVLEEDGFYHASTTRRKSRLVYDEVIEEMSHWCKTSPFDIRAHPERTFHNRLYICYRDRKDPESVVFLVRSIQKLTKGLRRK